MKNEMHYRCLTGSSFHDDDQYQLISVRQKDIELIRQWRNAQIDILRQKEEITIEQQRDYFQSSIFPTFPLEHPPQILFSFLLKGVLIGYGGLVHIDWRDRRGEVSFLIDPKRAANHALYAHDLVHFLHLLCHISFKMLHLRRLTTETFAFRRENIALFEQFGFKREGVLREHVFKHNRWTDSILHGLLSNEWIH